MSRQLEDRTVLVTGDFAGLPGVLADGLERFGARVLRAGPRARSDAGQDGPVREVDLDRRDDVQAAVAALAPGALDALVIVAARPPRADRLLVEMSEEDWDSECEAQMRIALWCAQAAHPRLRTSGGTIVFVVPTIGLVGQGALVGFATAAEGLRGLAKSVARAWGGDGVTANVLALPVSSFGISVTGEYEVPGRWQPALGHVPAVERDIVPALALLCGDGGRMFTGQTVVVDGGVVMAP